MNNFNLYGYQNPYNYPRLNTGMNWVQGEAGANAWNLGAGEVAVLFDSTRSVFYVKSVDNTGRPNPLEIYDYTKHTEPEQKQPDLSQYVTRDELKKTLETLSGGKHE